MKRPLIDKPLVVIPRCRHCGKAKNMHRAKTLHCPIGRRYDVGYLRFGKQRFEPIPVTA